MGQGLIDNVHANKQTLLKLYGIAYMVCRALGQRPDPQYLDPQLVADAGPIRIAADDEE